MYRLMALILLVTPAAAEEDRSWHLLTQSNEGAVSLLKDLTKRECEYASDRVMGRPATDAEKEAVQKTYEARHRRAVDWCAAHPRSLSGADEMWTEQYECENGEMIGVYWFSQGGNNPSSMKSAECFQ